MAVVISAPASGSGKTLLSLTILAWANSKGISIQPFKVGPDYLDPQLLSAASNRSCRNLDINICGEEWVEKSYREHGSNAKLSLIEGVMGLFDGIGSSERGSTAHVAHLLDLPVIMIIDASKQAASLGATIKGFIDFNPNIRVAGVVINKVNNS